MARPAKLDTRCILPLALLLTLSLSPTPGQADDVAAREIPELQLALLPCRHPARYERCQFDCDRQERHIEQRANCLIDIRPGAVSTCPEHLVAIVRQCDTACRADYCPQTRP